MRIEDVRVEERASTARLVATVTFETVARPPVDVYFEYVRDDDMAEARVEPFVATAAIVADDVGEARLVIDHPVDPRVVSNVRSAISVLRAWWPVDRPRLEWSTVARMPGPAAGGVAFCLTGGIDSTSLLVLNHATYPPGHPVRIDTGLVVYGLDDSTDGDVTAPDDFLRELTERFGVAIRAVRTNIRDLDPSTRAWTNRIQAAVLTGAGHAGLRRSRDLLIAPSDSSESLLPYGTHHVLDHRFGSTELGVHHEHVGESRVDRLRIVADRPDCMPFVQVCNRPRTEWGDSTINCGRCEKCLRTTVGFRAIGIDELPSFAGRVSAADVDALPAFRDVLDSWSEYVELLRARGDEELADAVVRFVTRSQRLARARAVVATLRRLRSRVSRR